MNFILIILFALGTFAIIAVSSPAYAVCAFDQENPFAPCDDYIGHLDYPKSLDELIPAPLKQMKLGIKLGHIICDQDKYPVWNVHYKPACVYDTSEGELLKRGWAKLRLMLPAGPDPITELEVMGHNVYSYQILGNYQVGDEKYPLSEPRKRELAWEYSEQYHPGESYLEYAITPHQNYYNTEDKIQFDLLEWGNYADCWDLQVRILDVQNNPVYEDNSIRHCYEPDGIPGRFHSFSMGDDFQEFVCDRPGYYRIEVSNGKIFPADILETFVCIDEKPEPEPQILKYNPVLFNGTGTGLQGEELENYIREKRKVMDDAFLELGVKGLYPITGESFSFGMPAYSLDEWYVGKPIALDIHILKEEFTRETLIKTDELVRKYVGDEIDIVYSKGVYVSWGSEQNNNSKENKIEN